MKLKSLVAVTAALGLIAIGCSTGTKTDTGTETKETLMNVDSRGQWIIETIAFNDSDYVCPEITMPGVHQYISFNDSTYFIQTNCNTISGICTIKGDSITFGDGAMTEMACENMDVENALRLILPRISTIDVKLDSKVRLNSDIPGEYIQLRKVTYQKVDNVVTEETAEDHTDPNIVKIISIYDNFVFAIDSDDVINHPEKFFTANALKKLQDAYKYDCDDAPCYAYYALRTDAQDSKPGYDGESTICRIEPAEDDWYIVSYLDMGWPGKIRIKMADGKIDDYERKVNNESNRH